MIKGADVFSAMGVYPDSPVCLNIATTGVTEPMGILEVTGSIGDDDGFQYFLKPEEPAVPHSLNYDYTWIPRHMYENSAITYSEFLAEIMPYLRERDPPVLVMNTESWFRKLRKSPSCSGLSPFFAFLAKLPLFPFLDYERARVEADFTIFDGTWEFFHEFREGMASAVSKVRYRYSVDLDKAYEIRGLPEIKPEFGVTRADVNAAKLKGLWECLMRSDEEDERYAFE